MKQAHDQESVYHRPDVLYQSSPPECMSEENEYLGDHTPCSRSIVLVLSILRRGTGSRGSASN